MPAIPFRAAAPALIVALALAGCSKHNAVDVKNASPEQVAKQASAAAPHFAPGRWETTIKFDKLDLGGTNPQAEQAMAQAMAQSMAKGHTVASCLTKAEAEKPSPKFFGGGEKACKYDHFSMADGKLDSKMTCNERGASTEMTMTGSFDSEHFDIHAVNHAAMPGGRAMNMEMSMSAHRVGECTGDEAK